MESLNRKNVFQMKKIINLIPIILLLFRLKIEIKKFLKSKGIDTAIHYPVPIHLQPAAEGLIIRQETYKQKNKLGQYLHCQLIV